MASRPLLTGPRSSASHRQPAPCRCSGRALLSHDGDRDLAARCAAGDAEAWALLVRQHDRRIALVVLRTLGPQGAADLSALRQGAYAPLLARRLAPPLAPRAP